MKNFEARERVAAWRRTRGFDRDVTRVCGILPLSPEELTASLWVEVEELKYAISLSASERSRQRERRFIYELKQEAVSMKLTNT